MKIKNKSLAIMTSIFILNIGYILFLSNTMPHIYNNLIFMVMVMSTTAVVNGMEIPKKNSSVVLCLITNKLIFAYEVLLIVIYMTVMNTSIVPMLILGILLGLQVALLTTRDRILNNFRNLEDMLRISLQYIYRSPYRVRYISGNETKYITWFDKAMAIHMILMDECSKKDLMLVLKEHNIKYHIKGDSLYIEC